MPYNRECNTLQDWLENCTEEEALQLVEQRIDELRISVERADSIMENLTLNDRELREMESEQFMSLYEATRQFHPPRLNPMAHYNYQSIWDVLPDSKPERLPIPINIKRKGDDL